MKRIPLLQTGIAVALVASVSFISVAGAAQTPLKQGKKMARWDSHPGLTRIMDCEEAGLCLKEERLLLHIEKETDRLKERLAEKGCKVVHALKGAVSIRCPKGVFVHGARKERALRAIGLRSAQFIQAPFAWNDGESITGNGVRVAILDTGIDSTHLELSSQITEQRNFTSYPLEDSLGHGTHVAGVVAGQGINDIDGNSAKGVSPGASLLVGKVCNDNGWCLEGDILAGMEWAVSAGAKVVNMSFGGGAFGSHCDGDTLAKKVNWMVDNGVVAAVAAGNNFSGVGTPACASKAIAVGAVDFSDSRVSWSSFGEALDVMAPGVRIFSSFSCVAAGSCPNPSYGWMSGTSFAAPHVAGAAALLLEKYPTLTPTQIYAVITASAVDLGGEGKDVYYGHGRVDMERAFDFATRLFPDLLCTDEDQDGVTTCDGDCNDGDASINPDAKEFCDGIDNDCDEITDDRCLFPFCGDHVCQGLEDRKTCPRDCKEKEKEKVKEEKAKEEKVKDKKVKEQQKTQKVKKVKKAKSTGSKGGGSSGGGGRGGGKGGGK